MSQHKRRLDPAKEIAILTFYWILELLPLFCLLNKPSTHKHAEWSGKSSLTLVKEAPSRAEVAACHFPCQGDICHGLLSCFLRRERDEPSPQQGYPSLLVLAPLLLLLLFQKAFHHPWLLAVYHIRRGENSILWGFYFFSKILTPFHSSYSEHLVYYIYHLLCLHEMASHL